MTTGTLINLSEKNRGLLIKLDGSDVEQWYTAHPNLNLKYAGYNKGKRVKLGFTKEDPSIINYVASENYVPKGKPSYSGNSPGAGAAGVPAASTDKSNYYKNRDRDIRSQMLVKAAIQLANTHNMYCVGAGLIDNLFEPTQANLKTLALELNKTIDEVKQLLGDADGDENAQDIW